MSVTSIFKTSILSIFLLFIAASNLHAQTPVGFKVMSYNIWGLPVPIKLKHPGIARIAQALPYYNPDVVAFQETFTKRADILAHVKEYPFVSYGPHVKKGITFLSSGLLTISKYPIVKTQSMVYSHCTSFDCFASKGVLLTTILHPQYGEIDFYNTHTNAGKSKKVKWSQLAELLLFIQKTNQGNPIILSGDMNITPDTGFYSFLQSTFLADGHELYVQDHPELSPELKSSFTHVSKKALSKKLIKKKIDYIWTDDRHMLYPINTQVVFDGSHDENKYSDHFALMTNFEFR